MRLLLSRKILLPAAIVVGALALSAPVFAHMAFPGSMGNWSPFTWSFPTWNPPSGPSPWPQPQSQPQPTPQPESQASTSTPTQQKCLSREQCGAGEYCTTEDGDCQSACEPGAQMCIQACAGVCKIR